MVIWCVTVGTDRMPHRSLRLTVAGLRRKRRCEADLAQLGRILAVAFGKGSEGAVRNPAGRFQELPRRVVTADHPRDRLAFAGILRGLQGGDQQA